MDRSNSQPYIIRVDTPRLTFAAAHFITFEGGGCEPIHGHDFRVVAELAARLGPAEYTVDFTLVEKLLAELIAPLDHHVLLPVEHPLMEMEVDESAYDIRLGARRWLLPAEDCVLVPVANTTAEAMARFLGEQLLAALGRHSDAKLEWLAVEYHEGPGYSARYRIEPTSD